MGPSGKSRSVDGQARSSCILIQVSNCIGAEQKGQDNMVKIKGSSGIGAYPGEVSGFCIMVLY